ncbi:hypothetical protein [Polynucleobacter sp. UK-Kesae-W10]|uniref:hypothetical protein n=1 Tax=Polynucleobacter sp. UK-Kesae-W10 TaxID=1819738 RepID=UPI001C0AE466|nr:hypothetical protein [Polynucleobacter sp. UK-Kesae-W10]MBU3577496.1 hypothetical protein [Polynucleobacter sp. UK-Kesae-W10]
MSEKIIPTVGRIVWFTPADHDGIGQLNGQPLAAIVAGVHSDTSVNLAVFDAYGNTQQRSSVRLVQPGEDKPDGGSYASWMPYQVKSAGIELPVVDAPALASDTPETDDNGDEVVDAEVRNTDAEQTPDAESGDESPAGSETAEESK